MLTDMGDFGNSELEEPEPCAVPGCDGLVKVRNMAVCVECHYLAYKVFWEEYAKDL